MLTSDWIDTHNSATAQAARHTDPPKLSKIRTFRKYNLQMHLHFTPIIIHLCDLSLPRIPSVLQNDQREPQNCEHVVRRAHPVVDRPSPSEVEYEGSPLSGVPNLTGRA